MEEKIKTQFFSFLDSIPHAASAPVSKNPERRAIQTLCQSAFRSGVQEESIKLLRGLLYQIECIHDAADIAKTLGEFAYCRIPSLFSVFQWYESGHPIHVRLALSVGSLGLPDTSYYLLKAPGKSTTLHMYGTLLDRLATELGLDTEIATLSAGIPLETEFAQALETANNTDDEEVLATGKRLHTLYPHIVWEKFWEGAHIRMSIVEKNPIKLMAPSWCKSVDTAIQHVPIDDWKRLFRIHLLLHATPLLPPPFDDLHFQFFDKQLRGQTAKPSQRELVLTLLQDWMTESLSSMYQREFIPPHLKQDVEQFVETVRKSTLHRIGQTDWLSADSQRAAIRKVKAMLLGVAYPTKPRTVHLPPLDKDNLLKNILQLGAKRSEEDEKTLNTVYHAKTAWEDAIYAVNAYYYSEINQLILPAGTLQWPFYDKRAPLGWNYGGLGAIVGHEITHAFDRDGRMYDEYGVRGGDGWSAADNREYMARADALIQLFNNARLSGKHHVDGEGTLDENIADLGGLAIALDALNTELDRHRVSEHERKIAHRRFFQAYAVSWRIKEKPAKVLQGLFMDSHAPAQFRVNLIVSQFEEWYQAFDVGVKDALYIPPEKRIRIF